MNISTSIKKSLLVSVSAMSAVGLLATMPLSASAQLTPGSSQMTPEPSADQSGSTEDIRDDAAVESSQMEGDMMTPGTGTRTVPTSTPNTMDGETTEDVGTGTSVPINSSQTERDDAATESSDIQRGVTTPSTGTNNTSPTNSSPTYSSPTYSSPTYSSPTTTTPSTTTPSATTNTSPRALW